MDSSNPKFKCDYNSNFFVESTLNKFNNVLIYYWCSIKLFLV